MIFPPKREHQSNGLVAKHDFILVLLRVMDLKVGTNLPNVGQLTGRIVMPASLQISYRRIQFGFQSP
jgi:hypothetical protein